MLSVAWHEISPILIIFFHRTLESLITWAEKFNLSNFKCWYYLQCAQCPSDQFKIIGWNNRSDIRNPEREEGSFLLHSLPFFFKWLVITFLKETKRFFWETWWYIAFQFGSVHFLKKGVGSVLPNVMSDVDHHLLSRGGPKFEPWRSLFLVGSPRLDSQCLRVSLWGYPTQRSNQKKIWKLNLLPCRKSVGIS